MRHFLVWGAVLIAACSGDNQEPADMLTSEPAPDGGSRASDGGAMSPTAQKIDVRGTVAQPDGTGVAGVLVHVIGAGGMTHDATTDDAGAFTLAQVEAPYDLRLYSSNDPAPNVYLGLTRSAVAITSGAGAMTENVAPIATIIRLPLCMPNCSLYAFTHSAEGGQSLTEESFSSSTPTNYPLSLQHVWPAVSGPSTHASAVELELLLTNSSSSAFWYAHIDVGDMAPSQGVGLPDGTLLLPLPALGPITISVNAPDLPSTATTHLQTVLRLPGSDAQLTYASVDSSSLVASVPNIPGATVRARAEAGGPLTPGSTLDYSNAMAWSDPQPLSTTSVTVDLVKTIAPVVPMPSGTISRSNGTFAWMPVAGRTSSVRIDKKSGKTEVTVYTDESKLSVARLRALGVVLSEEASYVYFDIGNDTSIDALLDPARLARMRGILDTEKGYAEAAFPFTPTP